jgi:hypothetical protein
VTALGDPQCNARDRVFHTRTPMNSSRTNQPRSCASRHSRREETPASTLSVTNDWPFASRLRMVPATRRRVTKFAAFKPIPGRAAINSIATLSGSRKRSLAVCGRVASSAAGVP